jgi:hypothetical protein
VRKRHGELILERDDEGGRSEILELRESFLHAEGADLLDDDDVGEDDELSSHAQGLLDEDRHILDARSGLRFGLQERKEEPSGAEQTHLRFY